jgi:tight adherence protein C
MEEIDRELPDVIDLVVVTVQAGLGLAASLRVASTKVRGPLGDELRLLMQEQKMGRSLSEAMNEMLARADTPSMRSFVRSVTQGEALGVSIGTIMRNLADEMRKRRRAAVEERAQKTPVKLLLPLVFLIFPSMLILLMAPSIFDMIDALSNGF